METLSILLAFCEGKPSVNVGFPSQGPVMRGRDAFLVVSLNNSRFDGDVRRHETHVGPL